MAEMVNLEFRDSPIVASELVKFLALNTGFYALKSLVNSNAALKIEVVALSKAVAGNTKAVTTAANSADTSEKQVEAFNKHLVKLETKK